MKISAGWLVAGIMLVFIIVLQLCGEPKRKDSKTSDTKTLQKRIEDTVQHYERLLKADSAAFKQAALNTRMQQAVLDKSRADFAASQKVIKRLSEKVLATDNVPEDDTWVKVSPDYKGSCDSLAKENIALAGRMQDYEDQSAEATRLMMYEISIRDSALTAQKEFNRKFLGQLDDCVRQLQSKANSGSRTQVYAGVGLFGNQINPLAGGQVNISLKTKRNQVYEITGATVRNTWYAGLGTKFLISFR